MAERVTCGGCAFLKLDTGSRCEGSCHRYPPMLIHDGDHERTLFPLVDTSDYCGEYKERDKCDMEYLNMWRLLFTEDKGFEFPNWDIAMVSTHNSLYDLIMYVFNNRIAFHCCKPHIARVYNDVGEILIQCENKELLKKLTGLQYYGARKALSDIIEKGDKSWPDE